MNKIIIIAKKEFKDILRSKIFIYVLLLLFALTLISLVVSELVFKDQVLQYNNSLEILKSIGKTPTTKAPQLYPLNLLRGSVDYIEIIGAILGIFLGYISIFKEKSSKAIKLILARPIKKSEIIYGKLLGNFIFVLILMIGVATLIAVTLPLVAGASLHFIDFIKLGIFVILSALYVLIFFTLSFLLSLQQKIIVNALIISFAVWLIFVLILPQIGDTMDPDNQVPGGFFKSMSLTKPQEKKVMANFKNYETVRTGVEQLSITKHYERASFAIFGIKKQYNDMTLKEVFHDKWSDMLAILIFLLIGIWADIIFLRKSKFLQI
ncbi:MAG TPA: hypothetical protein ENL06_00265 [Candidatus Portnoybacteria bacterium]|nr:hypothetical protein [Candidatus Portnoybacteria bacterium]